MVRRYNIDPKGRAVEDLSGDWVKYCDHFAERDMWIVEMDRFKQSLVAETAMLRTMNDRRVLQLEQEIQRWRHKSDRGLPSNLSLSAESTSRQVNVDTDSHLQS